MTKEQIAQSVVPIPSSSARRVTATVYRVAGRYEAAVQLDADDEAKPVFARRYRHPNLDQLLAIASTQETAALTGSSDWRQSTLDAIREAIFQAQDVEGPPTRSAGALAFDPKTATGEHRLGGFWSQVDPHAGLFIDHKIANLASIGIYPDGLDQDTGIVDLAAAAMILAARHRRTRDFGRGDVLKLLDVTRQHAARLPEGSTAGETAGGQ